LKAVDVKPGEEESQELDAMAAPATLYPHWLDDNLADAEHKEIPG
jgi:hypothetical protein